MKKRIDETTLKWSNVVVILEAIVVVILIIILLVVDWSGDEESKIESEPVVTESSTVMDGESSVSDEEESSSITVEESQNSKVKPNQADVSNGMQSEEEAEELEDVVGENSAVIEEVEVSQSQDNWGEIDWN